MYRLKLSSSDAAEVQSKSRYSHEGIGYITQEEPFRKIYVYFDIQHLCMMRNTGGEQQQTIVNTLNHMASNYLEVLNCLHDTLTRTRFNSMYYIVCAMPT